MIPPCALLCCSACPLCACLGVYALSCALAAVLTLLPAKHVYNNCCVCDGIMVCSVMAPSQAEEKREAARKAAVRDGKIAQQELAATLSNGILSENPADAVSALGPHRCVCVRRS